MRVQTRFFAIYRDLVGTSGLIVEVDAPARVADVVLALRERGGGFAALPAEPAVAVNMAYTSVDATVEDGDEVAFIPPVAGG